MTKYLVRQYRPAYFSGFTSQVMREVEYDEITKVPWLEQREDEPLTVESDRGTDELFVMRTLKNGEKWVVSIALPMDSKTVAPDGGLLRDNWRYKEHES